MISRVMVATILAFACASPVWAEPQQENHCVADQEKLCSRFHGLAVLKCLIDNYDRLTPACQKQMAPARAHVMRLEGKLPSEAAESAGDLSVACKVAIDKFCKESAGDTDKITACLKEHEAELSDNCKSAMKTAAEKSDEASQTGK